MSDRTPTTEQVRQGYAWDTSPGNPADSRVAFDRWLTAHDAEVRTAALEEAAVIADHAQTSAVKFGFDGLAEATVAEIIAERIRAAKVGD